MRRSYRDYWEANLLQKEREKGESCQSAAVSFKQMLSIRTTSKHNRINSVASFTNFCVYGPFPQKMIVSITKSNNADRITEDASMRVTCALAYCTFSVACSDMRYYFLFLVAYVARWHFSRISIFNSRKKEKKN